MKAWSIAGFASLLLLTPLHAEMPLDLPGQREPILRVISGGPTAMVTSLAFDPKGERLYAAGYDKVVRVWKHDKENRFVLEKSYRVPIGPGVAGAINAMALSSDGRWLAVGGSGVVHEETGFRENGIWMPRLGRFNKEMQQDEGTIWLFDTTQKGEARPLRGHLGPVLALRFAPAPRDKSPLLISVAVEPRESKRVYVLRLWDVENGTQQTQSPDIKDPASFRPGLAVWHTGENPRALAVALASNLKPVRVWDVATNEIKEYGAEGNYFSDTITYLPDRDGQGTLVVGCYQAPGGRLQRWRVRGRPSLEKLSDLVLVEGNAAPQALGTISDSAKGRLLAGIFRYSDDHPDPNKQFRCLLMDPSARNFGKVLARVDLWKGRAQPPLAVSADGKFLAVAGQRDNEIFLYTTLGLLEGTAKPRRLHSTGMTFERVAFARSDESPGLLLWPESDDKEAPLLWNINKGSISKGPGSWNEYGPDTKGWEIKRQRQFKDPKAPQLGWQDRLSIHHGDESLAPIRFNFLETPSTWALLPSSPVSGIPLVAVGSEDHQVTRLRLFNARTGTPLREWIGHNWPIQALAFSRDGRYLVSASKDQTICVWNLTDLGTTLGKCGRLNGLAVESSAGKAGLLRLAQLTLDLPFAVSADGTTLSERNENALQARKVAVGDLIEQVDGKVFQGPGASLAFYEYLWKKAPKDPVTLKIKGKGTVTLTLDQGIDTRKPLFSLYISQDQDRKYQWVGWNPLGPYDTSDPNWGDKAIGWHSNTNDPKKPTSFRYADQYRKEYYRPHILKYLIAKGDVPAALKALSTEPVPKPDMSLWLEELPPNAAPIVRDRSLTLKATVYGIPLRRIQAILWQIDNGPLQPFAEDAGRELTQELKNLNWKRGPHEIRLVVRTTAANASDDSRSLKVQYIPQAPRVRFDPSWLKKQFGAPLPTHLMVRAEKLLVKGQATPGDNGPGGPAVRLRLQHLGKTYEARGTTLEQEVTLQPGDNLLLLQAENVGASEETQALESATTQVIVRYQKPAPPQITLERISAEGSPDLVPDPKKILVVRVPEIQVQGRISAEVPLTEAARDGTRLKGFTPGTEKIYSIKESIHLKPGKQKITFTATAGKTKALPLALHVGYYPPLPRLAVEESRERIHEAGEPLHHLLEVRLTPLKYPHHYKAWVRLKGQKKEIPARVEDNLLSAEVDLRPGENHLEIVLRSTEDVPEEYASQVEALTIYHKRPPTILADSFRGQALSLEPLTTLEARLHSALPPTGIQLNGSTLAKEDITFNQVTGQPDTWTVRIRNVSLKKGANPFVLVAYNDDGVSPESEKITVVYAPPKPPEPASIEVLEPATSGNTEEPTCAFVFRVLSRDKAQVRVLVDGKEVKPQQKGNRYQIEKIQLKPGANLLRVEVLNKGGKVSAERVVSYTRRTIRVHLDDELQDLQRTQNWSIQKKVPTGLVRLNGWVAWPEGIDDLLYSRVHVRVWVNDFEQFSTQLQMPKRGRSMRSADPPGELATCSAVEEEVPASRKRRFSAIVRLNRQVNEVELGFPPGLKLEANEQTTVTIRCSHPEEDQRLHLLVLAPGQRDRKKVAKQILDSFLARDIQGNRFSTPAFKEGRLYGPLPWNIKREGVYTALINLRRILHSSTRKLNDVVIVCFQGEEAVYQGKHYLLTEESKRRGRYDETAVNIETLRAILSDVPGAKILLLDVRPMAGVTPAINPSFHRVGFFRYVWLGDPDVPPRARLTYALEASLQQAGRLGELARELKTWAKGIDKAGLDLLYPPGLSELLLGKEKGRSGPR
jgi:WD40 repeat protein